MKPLDIAAAAFGLICCILLFENSDVWVGWFPTEQSEQIEQTEPPVPSLPSVEVSPETHIGDYVVRVENHTKDGAVSGLGVLVEYEDEIYVLTSRMIFAESVGGILVNSFPASVVAEDKVGQIIALRVYTQHPLLGLDLIASEPEAELTVVTVGPIYPIEAGRSIRPLGSSRSAKAEWMVTKGLPSVAGAPVFSWDTLVGLVIGVSQWRDTETIVAKSSLLVKLLEGIE
jgi:hypothetical protein